MTVATTILTLDQRGNLRHNRTTITAPTMAAAMAETAGRYKNANWSGVFNPPEGYEFAWLPSNQRNKSRRIICVHPAEADHTAIRQAVDSALANATAVSAAILTIEASNREIAS